MMEELILRRLKITKEDLNEKYKLIQYDEYVELIKKIYNNILNLEVLEELFNNELNLNCTTNNESNKIVLIPSKLLLIIEGQQAIDIIENFIIYNYEDNKPLFTWEIKKSLLYDEKQEQILEELYETKNIEEVKEPFIKQNYFMYNDEIYFLSSVSLSASNFGEKYEIMMFKNNIKLASDEIVYEERFSSKEELLTTYNELLNKIVKQPEILKDYVEQ